MQLIRVHWEKGKPLVGVRNASPAFQKADNAIFDRKVMGGNYLGHFSNQPLKVIHIVKDHPVLRGVRSFCSRKLYKAGPLAKTSTLLQRGDIGTGPAGKQAITWVNEVKGRRAFYTSLGVPEDFKNENFRRMLVNAIFWTAKITRLGTGK